MSSSELASSWGNLRRQMVELSIWALVERDKQSIKPVSYIRPLPFVLQRQNTNSEENSNELHVGVPLAQSEHGLLEKQMALVNGAQNPSSQWNPSILNQTKRCKGQPNAFEPHQGGASEISPRNPGSAFSPGAATPALRARRVLLGADARAVRNDHFCDTTKRVSQRLPPPPRDSLVSQKWG